MRMIFDEEREGQVVLLDSLSEMMEAGIDGRLRRKNGREDDSAYIGGGWYGRSFANRESAVTSLSRPWLEGLEMMEGFKARLAHTLPEPVSVRRRPIWSETGGDLVTDRLLGGDPIMFRDVRRQRTKAPTNVALLCNVCENCDKTPDQITWRGAAAVACIDVLEQAGYNVELWAWAHTKYAFPGRLSDMYWACKLKACGDPLDPDVLVNGLSSWYFRIVLLGAMHNPEFGWYDKTPAYSSCGSATPFHGGFDSHLDVTENIVRIDMRAATSFDSAVKAAEDVLAQATKGGDE